jgi:hypothetical protein
MNEAVTVSPLEIAKPSDQGGWGPAALDERRECTRASSSSSRETRFPSLSRAKMKKET